MKSKITGILITLSLLLSLCLVASTQVMADPVVYYVDDDNTGSEDGTLVNPYNTITEAVTAASNGDTIIVAGGTYTETVNVDKSVKIKVQSLETATLTPSGGNGFYITADNVTIEGFTITGAYDAIYLDGVSGCTITGNTIGDSTDISIMLSYANTCIVQGNTCLDNTVYDIYIYYSEGNIILNNICQGDYAIYLEESARNNISGNSCEYGDYGIYLLDAIDNVFVANICSNYGEGYGIYITTGSSNVLYSRNTFIFNTLDDNDRGVYFNVPEIDASLIYFKNNNLTNNYTGVEYFSDTYFVDATQNYWAGNWNDVLGYVNMADRLYSPVLYSMTEIESWVTIITTTSTTTATSTSTETSTITSTTSLTETATLTSTATETSTTTETNTDTVIRTISSISTVPEGTVTMLDPTTLTETQSVTSTDTQTNTSTQFVTSTDTQSLTITVSVPQTVNHTTTTTLTATEETLDWPLIIIISVAGLLAGGLIVTIIIRKI